MRTDSEANRIVQVSWEASMKPEIAIMVGAAFALGAAAGIVFGGGAGLQAQSRGQRFEVERSGSVMSIRDTRTSACYIAIEGGGILQVQCAL
jgi:hypothetical protein